MLVVDRRAISRLHSHNNHHYGSGSMETMEISGNLLHEQRPRGGLLQDGGSTPSILLDSSETTSKGISPISLGYPPPSYDEVIPDFPPSYSEVSLMLKQQQQTFEMIHLNHLRTFVMDETNNVRERVFCDNNHRRDGNMNTEGDTSFCHVDDDNNNNINNDNNNNSIEEEEEVANNQDQMNNNNIEHHGHIEFVQEL